MGDDTASLEYIVNLGLDATDRWCEVGERSSLGLPVLNVMLPYSHETLERPFDLIAEYIDKSKYDPIHT